MVEEKSIELFSYDKNNYHTSIRQEQQDSKFDQSIREKWNTAEQNNIFRYLIKPQQCKILEGKYRFFVQLNVQRSTMRREPQEIMSMQQPFEPNGFHFLKILDQEILFDIGNGDGNDVIAVNVSPIVRDHCLLLPQRFRCLPQQVTQYSFQKALEVLLLSNSENLRLIFNSLCGYSSVNHLHWHLIYLNNRMLLEWIPLHQFIDQVFILKDFPAKGFCIKLASFQDKHINEYVAYAYKIVNCLQENQIAHNICITRSMTDIKKKEFDDIRIYIWARTPSYGIKNTKDFIIAACELFGHLPIRSEEAYESISEEYVTQNLHDTTANAFELAKEKILQTIQQTS